MVSWAVILGIGFPCCAGCPNIAVEEKCTVAFGVMRLDSRHLHGLLALILGVLAIFRREALLGTNAAWSKRVGGFGAVLIGVVLVGIGIWFLATP